MKGYQLTFFTLQARRHHGKLVSEWLLQCARDLGLRGGTTVLAAEGIGHNGKFHSGHFFELADQPVEVAMIVTEEESERLFQRIRNEKVHVFYAKTPVEFGFLGEDSSDLPAA
jgi:uncharacterized protein